MALSGETFCKSAEEGTKLIVKFFGDVLVAD